jgi:hypothetical protein
VGLNDVGLHITTVTEFSADKASVNYGVHSSVLTRAKDKNGCQKKRNRQHPASTTEELFMFLYPWMKNLKRNIVYDCHGCNIQTFVVSVVSTSLFLFLKNTLFFGLYAEAFEQSSARQKKSLVGLPDAVHLKN